MTKIISQPELKFGGVNTNFFRIGIYLKFHYQKQVFINRTMNDTYISDVSALLSCEGGKPQGSNTLANV